MFGKRLLVVIPAVLLLVTALAVVLVRLGGSAFAQDEGMWRGLVVADEARCASYHPDIYIPPRHIEADVVAAQGGLIYEPYSGTHFTSSSMTVVDQIIAPIEGHNSGLCASDIFAKKAFAEDLLNLTLAAPVTDVLIKGNRDAGEWLPPVNKCWYADRVVSVRQKYGMTIDRAEADALDKVFADCTSFEMTVSPNPHAPPTPTPTPEPTPEPTPTPTPEPEYHPSDTNRNGRIDAEEVLEVIRLYFAGRGG